MKYLAILALVLLSTQAHPFTNKQNIAGDLEDFLISFWPAAFGIQLDLGQCEGEVHQSLNVIQEALDMIHNTSAGFIDSYKDAFYHVYDNRNVFMTALNDCEATGPEFRAGIIKLIPLGDIPAASIAISKATLHNPWTFPKNIYNAKSYFSSGDFANCGKALGENLKLILAEMEVPAELKLVAELEIFMNAFWQSAFGIPLDLNGCTSNSEVAWTVIQKAMSILSDSLSPIAIAEAVYYIVSNYNSFVIAFDGCSDSMKALIQGVVEISALGSVEGFTTAMTGAMKSHPLGFMLNVKKATSAFQNGKYADAGKYLGQDLEWILEEVEETPAF